MYHSPSALGESMKNVFFCVLLVLASCVFSLGQTYKVLYSFQGPPNDGLEPEAALVADKQGNLYGTTRLGGNATAPVCQPYGCGTIFELSPSQDGSWSEAVIYNFCSKSSPPTCLDGAMPEAGLILDTKGNLYGTTYTGGVGCGYDTQGCGAVFELSPPQQTGDAWTETILYAFCSASECPEGIYPVSPVTFDDAGNLYGTTSTGGTGHDPGGLMWGGTVFELSPTGGGWTETTLYDFCTLGTGHQCLDGSSPVGGVTFAGGSLYGTTQYGGSSVLQKGTIFELSPGTNGWIETILYDLVGNNDLFTPQAPVSFYGGNMYTTFKGEALNGPGGVLRLSKQDGGRLSQFPFNFNNGALPLGALLFNNNAIYGTTELGGLVGGLDLSAGTIFELNGSGQETVLYNFCSQPSCTDGENPYAGLIRDAAGNLYGTTANGGLPSQLFFIFGNGVVFELTP
jgi:uncharacterized repeat protein (TIGR03803 family)